MNKNSLMLERINGMFQDFLSDRDEVLKSIVKGDYNPDPEYVVLSTNFEMKETFVFPSNEKGVIESAPEITSLSRRWDGTDDYLDTEKVLQALTEVTGHQYVLVEEVWDDCILKQFLYKRNGL